MLQLSIVICSAGLLLSVLILLYHRNRPPALVSYIIRPGVFSDDSKDPDFEKLYLTIGHLLHSSDRNLLRPKNQLIFEAIYSSNKGTRFVLSAPQEQIEIIKNQLLNLVPKLSFTKARSKDVSIPLSSKFHKITSWRLSSDINKKSSGVVSELGTNLHGALLKNNEYVNWRLCITSSQPVIGLQIIRKLLILGYNFLKILLKFLLELIENDPAAARQRASNRRVLQKTKTPDKETANSGLKVDISSIVLASSRKRTADLSLAVEAAARISSLEPLTTFSGTNKLRDYTLRKRLKPITLVNIDALGQIFSLPPPNSLWEEDAELNFSTELANGRAYLSKPDIVLGISKDRAIGLSTSERAKHMLVIGGTGMGKSTLLGYSIIQDIINGKGVAVIDPHGDLAAKILQYVPANRTKDVIYINPAQINYPVAINLMQLPSGVSGPELAIAKDFIAEAIISIFRKVFSDDASGGHRIEYILRNAIYTAFSVPNATLSTLSKLLTNDLYRSGVVSSLADSDLKQFWLGEYNKAGSFQRVKMISGVTAKLGRFQRSASVAGIINQPKSTIDFDKLYDEGKILICNLAKGTLGEDNSTLLGMVILAKLQLAAIRRVLHSLQDRTPFYLYVDEFEQFNAPIFSQLISEARKFGLFLTLAEQTTAYQSDQESNILLANVGNVVSFRTAADIDMRRVLPLFQPYVRGFDLANLEPYRFYLKASGESAKRPLSAQTITLKGDGSLRVASAIIKQSRQKYSVTPFNSSSNEDYSRLQRVPFAKS